MSLSNNLAFYGIILIFLGIILIIASSISQAKSNVRSAGIVFIGPFPLTYASDKAMFYILIALTIILMIIFYLLRK